MEPPIPLATVLEGFLTKQGGSRKTWKRRWFVLGRTTLYYYKTKRDLKALGEIPLNEIEEVAQVDDPNEAKRPYCFRIVNTHIPRTFYISCESEEERKIWIKAISEAVAREKTNPSPPAIGEENAGNVRPAPELVFDEGDLVSQRLTSNKWEADLLADSTIDRADNSSVPPSASNEASRHRQRTVSFTRERLLLSYRYMKSKLQQQNPPKVICIPPNEVYHRFGFSIAVVKLLKAYNTVDTIAFDDCKFNGDFFLEFVDFLKYQATQLSTVVFRNSLKAKNSQQDELARLANEFPPSVKALHFENVLSRHGFDELASGILATGRIVALSLNCSTNVRDFLGGGSGPLGSLLKSAAGGTLERLSLSRCALGDDGAAVLFAALQENKSLRTLDVSKNGISVKSRQPLFQFLFANTTLTSLDLSGNPLTDATADVFNALTSTQQSLVTLAMAKTRIPPHAVFPLAKLLQFNKSLVTLNIDDNRLREESGRILALALPQNTTLCQFSLNNCSLNPKDLEAILEITRRNSQRVAKDAKAMSTRERLLADFERDYTQQFQRLMAQLCIDDNMLAGIKRSEEFQKTQECATRNFEQFDEGDVSAFVNDEDIKYIRGDNGELISQMIQLVAFMHDFFRRKTAVDDGNGDMAGPRSGTIKEGYLFKRGARRRNWKRRWLVISGMFIFYYKSPEAPKHKGIIVLEGCRVRRGVGMTKFSFEVVTPNRTWLLSCDSAESMVSWMQAIESVAEHGPAAARADASAAAAAGAAVPLQELRTRLAGFTRAYEAARRRLGAPDSHTQWVLQWWFPQCLETMATLYLHKAGVARATANAVPPKATEPTRTTATANAVPLTAAADQLLKLFTENSVMAVHLMTGDYLYDVMLVRAVEGTTMFDGRVQTFEQLQREHCDRFAEIRKAVLKRQHQALPDVMNELSRMALLLRSNPAPTTIPAAAGTSPLATSPPVGSLLSTTAGSAVSTHAPYAPQTRLVPLFNALTQSADLSSVLWPLLADFSEDVLGDLLCLRKERITRSIGVGMSTGSSSSTSSGGSPTASTEGVREPILITCDITADHDGMKTRNSDARDVMFDFVPCPELDVSDALFTVKTLSTDELAAFPNVEVSGTTRTQRQLEQELLVTCIGRCPGLQALQDPMHRLLKFIEWLSHHWSLLESTRTTLLGQRDVDITLRQVFVLHLLNKSLKDSRISMVTLDMYSHWMDFRALSQDLIAHLALSAIQGFPRTNRECVQSPLELLEFLTMSTIVQLMDAAMATANAAKFAAVSTSVAHIGRPTISFTSPMYSPASAGLLATAATESPSA